MYDVDSFNFFPLRMGTSILGMSKSACVWPTERVCWWDEFMKLFWKRMRWASSSSQAACVESLRFTSDYTRFESNSACPYVSLSFKSYNSIIHLFIIYVSLQDLVWSHSLFGRFIALFIAHARAMAMPAEKISILPLTMSSFVAMFNKPVVCALPRKDWAMYSYLTNSMCYGTKKSEHPNACAQIHADR